VYYSMVNAFYIYAFTVMRVNLIILEI